MMKLLTDECVHQPTIQLFRLHHHDVKDIKELGLSRMSDFVLHANKELRAKLIKVIYLI